MQYIFLACGILIGFLIGIFTIGRTVIGGMIILDNPDGDKSLVFLELNEADGIEKAKDKKFVRIRVIKRKNSNY